MTDDTLREVRDQLEIARLLAEIAQLADEGDPEEYVACFTPDAVWDLTDATDLPLDVQRVQGRDALLAGVHQRRAAGVQGPGTHTCHDVGTVVIRVDGDRARVRSTFRYYRGTDATPRLAALGRYDDEFVRTLAGWRLHHRRISRL